MFVVLFFVDDNFIYGERKGKKYTGKFDTGTYLSKKYKCLAWNDPRVINYGYGESSFHDGYIPGPYCRNPLDPRTGAYSAFPWCYVQTQSHIRFANCSELKVRGKQCVV